MDELVQTEEDERELASWLADAGEEDEEESEDDPGDDVLELTRANARRLDVMERERRVDALIDQFNGKASPEAREIFAILSSGEELTEKKAKALMQKAVTKADEVGKRVPQVEEEADEDAVERRAAEIAQEAYGVGPLAAGGSNARTPEEEFDSRREAARRSRRPKDFYALYESLPGNGEVTVPD